MQVEFSFLGDERKLVVAKALGLSQGDACKLDATLANLDCLLLAARVHCLSKDELYFLQSPAELSQPLNHRNEAAAVSLLLQLTSADSASTSLLPAKERNEEEATRLRRQLSAHCESLWPQFRDDGDAAPAQLATHPAAVEFHRWAEEQGITSAIKVASFEGLRGCAAVEDVAPGQPLLSIPRRALMFEETVKETDLGRMLAVLPGLSADNLLIIFTLIDRFDPDSQWAPFWRSLPQAYYTGLSFPPAVISTLRGTAAHLEIIRAQTHLRKQYNDSRPLLDILLTAYSQHLDPSWFEYEKYIWAVELWYGYAFEVEFPPSPKSKTVMVPFACHVNHSPWPHVVRYGRINPGTDALEYPAFRPCPKGAQAFISYGPVPNMKLITYYGFAVAENPHDLVPLTLEPPEGGLTAAQSAALAAHGIGMEHSLRDGPLAGQLLGCLRVVVATPEEVESVLSGKKDPTKGALSAAGEAQALETLEVALQGLLGPVVEGLANLDARKVEENGGKGEKKEKAEERNENGLDADWKASTEFCRVYVEGQRFILERSLEECRKLLRSL